MIKKLSEVIKILFAVALLFLVSSNQTSAESLQLLPINESYFAVEIMKPNLDGAANVDAISSIWYFSAHFPVGKSGISMFTELPFSYYSDAALSAGYYELSDINYKFLVGNPLIGVEIRKSGSTTGGYGTFAVRLPIADEKRVFPIIYAFVTDFDRFDAFLPNQYSIQLGGGGRFDLGAQDYELRFDIGATVMGIIPEDSRFDTELFLKYYGQFWLMFPKVNLNLGLSGIAIITERDLDLSERIEQQLTFGIQLKPGKVRPGAFIRIPLTDELSQSIEFVAGINLTFVVGD